MPDSDDMKSLHQSMVAIALMIAEDELATNEHGADVQ